MKLKFLNSNKQLSFYLMKNAKLSSVPVLGDAVPAGFPSPAEDYLDMDLNLHDYLVRNPAATFCVRVSGGSMVSADIKSGDVMVIDRALDPTNNSIVLAVLNGEFTVKRIKKRANELYIIADNEEYQPMKITKDVDFQVWGVVTFIIHKAI